MKKLKFILSAVMLTVCMSAFIGAGGATAFAYEGEQEPVAECTHEYTEEVVEGMFGQSSICISTAKVLIR